MSGLTNTQTTTCLVDKAQHPLIMEFKSRLRLRPITRSEARAFVGRNHRHNKAHLGELFAVGLEEGDTLVGVGVASRPVARALCDGRTCEITRLCVTTKQNACSMLYGALCRAAQALGYTRVITYTLESESGASLRASNFVADGIVQPTSWSHKSRHRYEVDLFGNELIPSGPKIRWVRNF